MNVININGVAVEIDDGSIRIEHAGTREITVNGERYVPVRAQPINIPERPFYTPPTPTPIPDRGMDGGAYRTPGRPIMIDLDKDERREIDGPVGPVTVHASKGPCILVINGNVEGDVLSEGAGDVTCDTVTGSVRSAGDVDVQGLIGGSVRAGGDVNCDNVGGSVQAGGDVTCDHVGGLSPSGSSRDLSGLIQRLGIGGISVSSGIRGSNVTIDGHGQTVTVDETGVHIRKKS